MHYYYEMRYIPAYENVNICTLYSTYMFINIYIRGLMYCSNNLCFSEFSKPTKHIIHIDNIIYIHINTYTFINMRNTMFR